MRNPEIRLPPARSAHDRARQAWLADLPATRPELKWAAHKVLTEQIDVMRPDANAICDHHN
jgi:hypothetical protein